MRNRTSSAHRGAFSLQSASTKCVLIDIPRGVASIWLQYINRL